VRVKVYVCFGFFIHRLLVDDSSPVSSLLPTASECNVHATLPRTAPPSCQILNMLALAHEERQNPTCSITESFKRFAHKGTRRALVQIPPHSIAGNRGTDK